LICSFNFIIFLAVCLNISTAINIKILTNSNQQTQSYKFTSHITAFYSVVLITEMLEISQKKKYKRTNNDQQNISYKTKDRVIRTPLKTGSGLRCSERVRNSCSTSDTRRVNLVFILIRKCYEVLYSSGYRQG
jgi:hypothetical protein